MAVSPGWSLFRRFRCSSGVRSRQRWYWLSCSGGKQIMATTRIVWSKPSSGPEGVKPNSRARPWTGRGGSYLRCPNRPARRWTSGSGSRGDPWSTRYGPLVLDRARSLSSSVTTSVASAGLITTDPKHHTLHHGRKFPKGMVGVGASLLSVALMGLAFLADGEIRYQTLAPLVVVFVVFLISSLAQRAKVSAGSIADRGDPGKVGDGQLDDEMVAWVGALAGFVLVSGGLALVRASFLPVHLGESEYSAPLVVGIIVALFSGMVYQRLLIGLYSPRATKRRR